MTADEDSERPAVPEPARTSANHLAIEDRDEYLAAVETVRGGHGPAAIDAERASGYRYSQRAYLIQV